MKAGCAWRIMPPPETAAHNLITWKSVALSKPPSKAEPSMFSSALEGLLHFPLCLLIILSNLYPRGSQHVVPEPATSASWEACERCRFSDIPRSSASGTQGVGPKELSDRSSRWCQCHLSLETMFLTTGTSFAVCCLQWFLQGLSKAAGMSVLSF